jgi:selenocysteine lyase/cysteine desulfurase
MAEQVRKNTRMIAMTHASNVTGSIMPLDDAASIAGKHGLLLLLDAAQTAGRLPLSGGADLADAIAFSGHKELFGPQGTGCLYVRKGLAIKPMLCGGTGNESTSIRQPTELPEALESGTLNAPGIAGLGAGVSFVRDVGLEEIRRHEMELMGRLLEGLEGIKGVISHGPAADRRVGIAALTFEGHSPPEIAEKLDSRYGIATRAGLHCSPMAHRTMGTIQTGALRVSLSYMNSTEDIDHMLTALRELLS